VSALSDFEVRELDKSLAEGEDIELQRLTGTVLIPFKVTCRASVRNYDVKELVGSITQDQSEVIISPTEIIRRGWPGPWTPKQSEPTKPKRDLRVPVKGDKAVIAGKQRNIEVVRPKYADGELVRITMRVLG